MKRCIIICSLKVILFMVFLVSLTAADSDTPIENPESLKDVVVGQNGVISSLPEVVLPYIARKVQKSIVSIRTIKGNEVVGFDNEGNPSFKEKIIGTASGIIINSEGYILTFRGAIANTPLKKIEVILHPEEKAIEAKVVGWDKKTDLAVLKIDSLIPLSPASLGDSDKIRIGEQIFTLGYSGNSLIVTTGRISARSLNTADLPLGSINMNIIPVDTTIPSGSTGGALVNMKGEVIGVLYLRTEGGVGEGFCCAIPINSAKPVIDKLIKLGRVASGWLGVVIEDIKPELAKSLGLSDLNGAFVMEVFPDTPAEKAGLKVEDVIRNFDGKEVKSSRDLIMAIATIDVGKRVKVLIIRDKSEKEIEVEIGERPNPPSQKSETKQEIPVLGNVPVIGRIRRDAKEEYDSGYALTVESDGSYLLRFPPNSETEVAGCLDQIFQNRTRFDIQFVPEVTPSAMKMDDTSEKDKMLSYVAGKYAKIREYSQAIQVAGKIRNEYNKSEALAEIASEYADAGKFALALRLTEIIKDEGKETSVLEKVSQGYKRTGRDDEALQINKTIEYLHKDVISPSSRKAYFCLDAGKYNEVLQVANTMGNDRGKAILLANIAVGYFKSGHKEKGLETFSQAVQVVEMIEDGFQKSFGLSYIAEKYYENVENDKATELLGKALEVAGTIENASQKAMALAEVAGKYAKTGLKIANKTKEILTGINKNTRRFWQ